MALWNDIELDGLVLHTGRLTLRPWQTSDAVTVQTVMSDERMRRFLPLPNPYTEQDALEFVTTIGPARAAAGGGFDMAICENTTGRVAGAIGFHLQGAGETAEIGYWVATDEWGQGFAREAVTTVARFALGNGIKRLTIHCDTANVASARVALACGFGFEGIARGVPVRGWVIDGPLFSRLPADDGAPIAPRWPHLTELTDGEVLVRPMSAEDWPTVLAEQNNEAALRWSFTGTESTEADAKATTARSRLDWLVGEKARFTICDARTGAGAGSLTVMRSGPMDVGLVGYGVVPEFRGRGFTARALKLVSAWIFDNTSIARLELGHKVENVASGKAAMKAGFQREATFAGRLRNHDGTFSDEHYYGLVKPTTH